MPKLFILGAGFSKALHDGMPLLNDLSRNLDWSTLPASRPEHKRLSGDIEQLLSYLYQEMPWKSLEEKHLDMALFYAISRQIADYISECEKRAFADKVPEWGKRFAQFLHRMQATVVTLNYDTALERLLGRLERDVVGSRWPDMSTGIERDFVLDDIYRMPMLPLEERTKNLLGKHPTPTLHLLKPHGSINWYSLGGDDPAGNQLFYEGIPGFYPDATEETGMPPNSYRNQLRDNNKRDLVPLIIPPVAEKSAFYQTHAVKILWSDFAEALKTATEIYFVGYSLPKSDLSMRLFLKALIGESNKIVYRVNRDDSSWLKDNYAEVLVGCQWQDDFLGFPNAVERMVDNLASEYQHKREIAHQIAVQSGWLLKCPNCGDYAIAHLDTAHQASTRQETRRRVEQLFKEDAPLVNAFKGDEKELLFLINELDSNRGYTWECPCKHLSVNTTNIGTLP